MPTPTQTVPMTTSGSSSRVDVLDQLLHERHSCRAFLPDAVPDSTIERLLLLAQRTPSWCNTQPWKVVVTRGQGTDRMRRALTAADDEEPDLPFPEAYNGPYRDRRRAAARRLYQAVGVQWGDRAASAREAARNFELFDAPHLAVITTDTGLGTYGAVDCGLYVQTFLLAAQALELGAIPQAAIAARSRTVRQVLNLTDDRMVLCGISFGLPDPNNPGAAVHAERASLSDVVTYLD
ncbi:nitroreductase [Rhodococcus wratislaviensis]|uniref:Putative nitroreductase n=1 Tax=Rhodococcus wratislaviensis NBRC 100605 TaxID=1219028 RepID=X0PL23_RHOWR|nr:nitroreductase [Rhodococcus wratislaviensis]GAF43028.1 putative nitroreductase [Rhodococcus wratislaviensis NBRC 100605]